jgi:lipoate-protein ligase A
MMLQCTIPLFGELARISDALWFDMPGQRLALKARIGYRAATIESLMGRRVEYSEVSDAIQQGFSKGLNVVFSAGDLSEFESSRASELRAEKYTSESWTMKI